MKLKKTIATFAAAFALVVGGASMASAAPGYTPQPEGGPTTITPGGTGTFTFIDFEPGESVTFTLTGENGAGATLAALAAITTSAPVTKTADADGAVAVQVTLPANATGNYTLTADGELSDPITVTIAATIAATGADVSPLLIWGAVGAVGLGVIALIAIAAVRRNREAELVE